MFEEDTNRKMKALLDQAQTLKEKHAEEQDRNKKAANAMKAYEDKIR
jgi:hypothetical protein